MVALLVGNEKRLVKLQTLPDIKDWRIKEIAREVI